MGHLPFHWGPGHIGTAPGVPVISGLPYILFLLGLSCFGEPSRPRQIYVLPPSRPSPVPTSRFSLSFFSPLVHHNPSLSSEEQAPYQPRLSVRNPLRAATQSTQSKQWVDSNKENVEGSHAIANDEEDVDIEVEETLDRRISVTLESMPHPPLRSTSPLSLPSIPETSVLLISQKKGKTLSYWEI